MAGGVSGWDLGLCSNGYGARPSNTLLPLGHAQSLRGQWSVRFTAHPQFSQWLECGQAETPARLGRSNYLTPPPSMGVNAGQ